MKACQKCGSNAIVKFGFVYRSTGKVQRYVCKDCFKISIEQKGVKT